MAKPQDKFLDLVHLVLITTWYTFHSQFYQQTNGVAMGGPASSPTAEIYMQAYKRTAITTALHPSNVWERFVVDGVYSIIKRTHLENFLHHINNLHQNIGETLHPPNVWERFVVNDVYSIIKRTHLENFFHYINDFHQNIEFTIEEESNG